MKNRTQKALKWVINHKVLGVVILATIGLLGWWLVTTYMPHPLGERTIYLGKKDYGNIIGFDSKPYSVYYYGTDMDLDELIEYLKGASLEETYSIMTYSKDVYLTYQGKDIYITYYTNKSFAKINNTDKKYVFSTLGQNYPLLKDSLK